MLTRECTRSENDKSSKNRTKIPNKHGVMFEPSALSTHNWEGKSASSRRNKALTVSRFTQRIKQN